MMGYIPATRLFVNPEERKNLYSEYVGSVLPRNVANHYLNYRVSDTEDLNLLR